jgi:hypothetical protein
MKNAFRIVTAAAAFAIAATTIPAVAASLAPQDRRDNVQTDRNEHPEYTSNRYYRLGNKEGYDDHRRNVQRKQHNHKFSSDDDRKAHDYGYQQGWSGTRYNSNDRH